MSVNERLAQEDHILREIRMTLSTFRTVGLDIPRRKGAVYASSPITSGLRCYEEMRHRSITSYAQFRADKPNAFLNNVMRPNLQVGARFGERLRKKGWPLVIVPGEFFAKSWTQEHYMSLWRQVIVRYARTVSFNVGWQWSVGCAEEFLIAIQSGKRMMDWAARPIDPQEGANVLRSTIDTIDEWGFDAKPLYDLWRQIQLTLEATQAPAKTA